ncbi:hypothetical protein ACFY8W_03255 [Streptomyces sp. NPDC012637]|uniref:cyanobactin maturation protease PatG family protein n=1 Tax=Streptomyces sp. NPDC012637 TaxID=3364842 RepID=UPI0036ECDA24
MDAEITDTVIATGPPPEAEVRPSPPAPASASPPALPTLDPEDFRPASAVDEAIPTVPRDTAQARCGCTTAASPGGEEGDGGTTLGYVYALGRVHALFPDLSVQHEYFQAAGAGGRTDSTDAEALYRVLSDPENRYIARQMCFVLSVEGVETHILRPADQTELDELVEALRPVRDNRDLAVVVGYLGPVAPPGACQGLSLTQVSVEKVWAFDRKELIKAIERRVDVSKKEFERGARDTLDRLLQLGNNAGTLPTERAVNHLTVRSQEIYQTCHERRDEGYVLSGVEAGPSRLSTRSQTVVTVVFSYTHRQTNVVVRSFARVDVTGLFPRTVTSFQDYYHR